MNKYQIVKEVLKEWANAPFAGDFNQYIERKLSLTQEDKPKCGVIFSDGEFVPIEDESIMQEIAELLPPQEE